MKTPQHFLITLGTAAILLSGVARGAETKTACTALPPAVQAAIQQASTGATIKNCVVDKGPGKITYEAETVEAGKSRDITFNAAGTVLEIEQEVGKDQLPAPVASAIDASTRGSTVNKIESLSRGGKIVSYEAAYTSGGKAKEIAFTPDGKRKHGG